MVYAASPPTYLYSGSQPYAVVQLATLAGFGLWWLFVAILFRRRHARPMAASAHSLAADEAKGSFQFGKATFQISNGMAYQRDGSDPKKPVTMVILADFKIDQPAVVAAIDPANALLTQVMKNQAGNFLIVTLASPNRCGIQAFLESGKQVESESCRACGAKNIR